MVVGAVINLFLHVSHQRRGGVNRLIAALPRPFINRFNLPDLVDVSESLRQLVGQEIVGSRNHHQSAVKAGGFLCKAFKQAQILFEPPGIIAAVFIEEIAIPSVDDSIVFDLSKGGFSS